MGMMMDICRDHFSVQYHMLKDCTPHCSALVHKVSNLKVKNKVLCSFLKNFLLYMAKLFEGLVKKGSYFSQAGDKSIH